MFGQFLLFVIAILLLSIFWVLSKINSNLKKKDAVYREVLGREEGKKKFPRSSV